MDGVVNPGWEGGGEIKVHGGGGNACAEGASPSACDHPHFAKALEASACLYVNRKKRN